MKNLLLSLSISTLKEVAERYSAKVPKPLCGGFPDGVDKGTALQNYQARAKKQNTLIPASMYCKCLHELHVASTVCCFRGLLNLRASEPCEPRSEPCEPCEPFFEYFFFFYWFRIWQVIDHFAADYHLTIALNT